MSDGTGAVAEMFGGEERFFLIRIGELRKIQTVCGMGPAAIAERLARCVYVLRKHRDLPAVERVMLGLGDWRIDDIREPVLQGLIGGGMAPNDAGALVREWIDDRGFMGLLENAPLALTLIMAGSAQAEDEPLGETPATKAPSPPKTLDA